MLDDGRYDAMVVSADERDDARLDLSLAITSGAHKGEVVDLVAPRLGGLDALDVLALPCTLVVVDGRPHVEA